MAAYLVEDIIDSKKFIVEAGSAHAAESRLVAGRFNTRTISNAAEAAGLVAKGAEYIGADDEWPRHVQNITSTAEVAEALGLDDKESKQDAKA